MRRALTGAVALGALIAGVFFSPPGPAPAVAAPPPAPTPTTIWSCVIQTNLSGTGVAFGVYDPLVASPISTVWTVYWTCPYGQGGYNVSFSAGNSGNLHGRYMLDALGEKLTYNLYLDAAHTQIWGDGSQGTAVLTGAASTQTNYATNVYGLLNGGQKNVTGGQAFLDWIVATINY